MRSIAVETQKDSFAMKTIAVLGMVFLPGTFIAVSTPQYPVGKYQRLLMDGLGRFRNACVRLGWKWHAGHQDRFQVLLAHYGTIDNTRADLMGGGYALALEDLVCQR
jgi:hypothetical protein